MRIELEDVTLSVQDTGAGSPVVLLHGWPDTADLWRHQVPALAAGGYRVIAPDLRGFGESSKPAETEAYAAPRMVGDVVGLLDHLGVERAHLVGHDWGAAIAWMTAALVPDRVASVTALSVGHPAAFRERRLGAAGEVLVHAPVPVPRRRRGVAERRRLPQPPGVVAASRHRRGRRAPGRTRALTAGLNLYRAILPPASLLGPPLELPPVQAPAMGIWSSGDLALTEEQMTGSAKHVTGPWRYERLDGLGHWPQLEAPRS